MIQKCVLNEALTLHYSIDLIITIDMPLSASVLSFPHQYPQFQQH